MVLELAHVQHMFGKRQLSLTPPLGVRYFLLVFVRWGFVFARFGPVVLVLLRWGLGARCFCLGFFCVGGVVGILPPSPGSVGFGRFFIFGPRRVLSY